MRSESSYDNDAHAKKNLLETKPKESRLEKTPPVRGRPPKGASLPKYEHRIQIKLTEEGRERLDMLVERVGASGIGEVIREALRIYDILSEEIFVNDNQLLIRDKNKGEIERLTLWRK